MISASNLSEKVNNKPDLPSPKICWSRFGINDELGEPSSRTQLI